MSFRLGGFDVLGMIAGSDGAMHLTLKGPNEHGTVCLRGRAKVTELRPIAPDSFDASAMNAYQHRVALEARMKAMLAATIVFEGEHVYDPDFAEVSDNQPSPRKGTAMNYSKAVFLFNNQTRAIKCMYDPLVKNNVVTFKTLDQNIKVDDLVLVPSGSRHNVTVTKVIEVDVDIDIDDPTPCNWIIAVVDQTAFKETVALENESIKKVRSGELRSKRDAMAKAVFNDQMETMKALPLAHFNGSTNGEPKA